MGVLKNVIKEEFTRLNQLKQLYESKLSKLLKGTIREKKRGEKTYYYLKYYNGEKVKTDYIKKSDLEVVKKQLIERKRIENLLKGIKEDLKIAKKVVKVNE